MRAMKYGSALLVGLLVTACAPDRWMEQVAAGGETVAPTSVEMNMMRDTCPVLVPGTQVSYRNTSTGVEVTFLTDSQHVGELRDRVDALAAMYSGPNRDLLWYPMDGAQVQRAAFPADDPGMMQHRDMPMQPHDPMMHEHEVMDERGAMTPQVQQARAGQSAMYHGPMPRARAQAEPVQGGARLNVVAANPQQVQTLRQHVQLHVQDMQEGRCPMPRRTPTT